MLDTEKLLEQIRQIGLEEPTIREIRRKVKEAKETFLNSLSRVYCQTCGILFYEGFVWGIMEPSTVIWDFRYLAFRHCWNNPEHIVVADIPFFRVATEELHKGIFNYSNEVHKLRERMRLSGDMRISNSCDQNWNAQSRVLCSNCKREFSDLKEACYCCYGTKPFLPYQELEGIP